MNFFLVLLLLTLTAFLTAKLAEERGRNPYIWFWVGLLFGILGLAALFLFEIFDPKTKTPEVQHEKNGIESDDSTQMIISSSESSEKIDPLELGVWYFVDKTGSQRGPVDFTDLFIAWEDGLLAPEQLVWHESFTDWKPFADCKNVMLLFNEKKNRNEELRELKEEE